MGVSGFILVLLPIYFFQNEEIFIELAELDEME